MATEVHADWRARQKERERERRRMRDRQRRQSMSVEEREKHLARRRRNYQLRRQRAATKVESDSFSDNHLAIECISDVNVIQDGFSEAYEAEQDLVLKHDDDAGETMHLETPYKYPRLPRLNHIRKLARVLNAANPNC